MTSDEMDQAAGELLVTGTPSAPPPAAHTTSSRPPDHDQHEFIV